MTARARLAVWLIASGGLAGCVGSGAPQQISASNAGSFEVSLASSNGRIVAAWYDTRDGNAEIYMRTLGDDTERRLTTTAADSFVPEVAWLGEDIVVAWFEKSADDRTIAKVGRWSGTGSAIWQRTLGPDATHSRNPIALVDDNRLFVAWIELDEFESGRVMGQWLDSAGHPSGTPLHLGKASSDTWNLNGAVVAANRMLIAYDSSASTRANEVYLTDVAATHASTRRLTADDGYDSKYPDLAVTSAGLLLSWQDTRDGNSEVYVIASAADRMVAPIDHTASRITTTTGQSIGAYVAAAGDRAAIVWCDDSEGNFEVFFQSLTLDGYVAGPVERLNRAPSDALIPAIVPARNGFAVAWNEILNSSAGYHVQTTRSEILFREVH